MAKVDEELKAFSGDFENKIPIRDIFVQQHCSSTLLNANDVIVEAPD